jgi:hypothetical protein
MLARGTQPSNLGEVKVRVIVQLNLKRIYKNVTNPVIKSSTSKYRNLYKASSSKSKSKNGTVPYEFCSVVEHQKLGQLYQLSNQYSYDSVY